MNKTYPDLLESVEHVTAAVAVAAPAADAVVAYFVVDGVFATASVVAVVVAAAAAVVVGAYFVDGVFAAASVVAASVVAAAVVAVAAVITAAASSYDVGSAEILFPWLLGHLKTAAADLICVFGRDLAFHLVT